MEPVDYTDPGVYRREWRAKVSQPEAEPHTVLVAQGESSVVFPEACPVCCRPARTPILVEKVFEFNVMVGVPLPQS